MKSEVPNYFEQVQEYFLNKFLIFSNNQPVINKQALLIQPKNEGNTFTNFILDITVENSITQRKILFSYREGPNALRTISNHIILEFENISEIPISGRRKFFIQDFCSYHEIEMVEPSFYQTLGENDSFEKFKKYMNSVTRIIESTILHKILAGEVWENIPIDMSPYK